MDKKHKRSAKKRNAKKLNRPTNPKPLETKQTLKSIEAKPAILLIQTEKPNEGNPVLGRENKQGEKPLWHKGVVLICSLVALIVGFFGYEALWPKVIIDPSQAVDPGIASYQFDFKNQSCYPVEVISTIM